MSRCLELAQNGLGTTYPNPLVGCVIVYKDRIIGQGWHHHAGGPHAEVVAINSVEDKSLLKESTLFVSLEPCSHFGKTPPCADLIISTGIREVVICNTDPNPLVAGRGIEKLKNAGIWVVVGVLESEGREINRRFFANQEKKRPYVILKWAQTADGFLSPANRESNNPVWITSSLSRQLVHKWRTEEHSILVGTQTVADDNPQLTAREWQGNQPIRIVIDKSGRLSKDSYIFDNQSKTIAIHGMSQPNFPVGVLPERIDFDNMPKQILEVLNRHGIASVIVEGGQKTLQSFIDAGLWDEARVFVGQKVFGSGTSSPQIVGRLLSKELIDQDELLVYRP